MIDTHCHVDMHDDPLECARKFESLEIECVATTMLPSHYRLGLPHLAHFKGIHASLGMHPLRIGEGKSEVESFITLSQTCDYIGEIGLDFSREGESTKQLQLEVFLRIISSVKGGKFVSVHSRGAAAEILEILDKHRIGPVCFHYFTAGLDVASAVVRAGHYFSFNHRMLNGKHKFLLDIVPKDKVLVESDAPFLTKGPINAIKDSYSKIAEYWELSISDATNAIAQNFANCRTAS